MLEADQEVFELQVPPQELLELGRRFQLLGERLKVKELMTLIRVVAAHTSEERLLPRESGASC